MILLSYLLVFVLLMLLMRSGVHFTRQILAKTNPNFRDGEAILADRSPPESWLREADRQYPVSGRLPVSIAARLKREYFIRRLETLVDFYSGTTLIRSEELREKYLEKLINIQDEWERSEWEITE